MNTLATPSEVKHQPMQILVVGRIESSSQYQGTYSTLVRTPAPDEYSYPSLMPLRSKKRLGAAGDECAALCRASGIPRTFERKDKNTGEITRVQTADVYFNVIE